jgi:hypothetical protein
MPKERTPVKEWRNMNQAKEIAKEWEAFDKAKGALVKAIRKAHGDDAPISFQRYSFGIPEVVTVAKVGKVGNGKTKLTPDQITLLQNLLASQLEG